MGYFKTKPAKAGKPWTSEEMLLVGSFVPTADNVRILAKRLERTERAISCFYSKLYLPIDDLKFRARNDKTESKQYQNILAVRQELRLSIDERVN